MHAHWVPATLVANPEAEWKGATTLGRIGAAFALYLPRLLKTSSTLVLKLHTVLFTKNS